MDNATSEIEKIFGPQKAQLAKTAEEDRMQAQAESNTDLLLGQINRRMAHQETGIVIGYVRTHKVNKGQKEKCWEEFDRHFSQDVSLEEKARKNLLYRLGFADAKGVTKANLAKELGELRGKDVDDEVYLVESPAVKGLYLVRMVHPARNPFKNNRLTGHFLLEHLVVARNQEQLFNLIGIKTKSKT